MSGGLVERLRRRINAPGKRKPTPRELEAADRIEALEAAIVQAREALEAEYERARLGPSSPGLAICEAINRIRAALDKQ